MEHQLLEKHGSAASFERLYAGIWTICQDVLDKWVNKNVLYNFTDTIVLDVQDLRDILGDLHKDFPLDNFQLQLQFVLKGNLKDINYHGGFIEQAYDADRQVCINLTLEFPRYGSFHKPDAYKTLKYILKHELQHVYEKLKNRSRSLLLPQDNLSNVVTQEYPELSRLLYYLYVSGKAEMNANIAAYDADTPAETKTIAYNLRNFDVTQTMQDLLDEAKENGYSPQTYNRTFGKWLNKLYKDAAKGIKDAVTNKELLVIPAWIVALRHKDMLTCLLAMEKRFKVAGNYMYRKMVKRHV